LAANYANYANFFDWVGFVVMVDQASGVQRLVTEVEEQAD